MFLSLDGAFTKIGIWIVVGIYNVAAAAFKIFLILATGEVVSPSTYNDIIKNFYIVIGIVMLFVLAFSLLKGMVNPDDQKNGTSTIKKIILNLVSSGIIMAVLPTIFAFAYDFQDSVLLTQNTIGRFFNYGSLESTEGGNTIDEIGKGAYSITNGVFSAFLNVNESKCDGSDIATCQESVHARDGDKISFAAALKMAEDEGRFSQYTDFSENVAKDEVDFNFLLSILAGLILIYVAVSFCFDMAVRLVKLVFYQIIAPIPLFMRIVPNSKFSDMFSKWTKITLACYAEVYIRIFIFYFTVYLCKAVLSAPFLTTNVFKWGFFIGLLTKAFILMGLVMFMRQAPKLIKDITGLDSGNMKLGIREKLKEGGAYAAGAALGAGTQALVRNGVGAYKNAANKFKGIKTKEGGWNKTKAIGSAVGSVFGGVASMIGGAASGTARGLKAGAGAKNASEMKKAAQTGAKGAVDAKDKRDTYKASHGGKFITIEKGDDGKKHIGGVVGGHLSDSLETAAEWAGIKLDYSALQAERSSSDAMLKSLSNIKNVSEDYIKKHKQEFYVGLSATELSEIESYRKAEKEAEKAGDTARLVEAKRKISEFESRIGADGQTYGSKRLDVMEQTMDAMKTRGPRKTEQTEEEFAAEVTSIRQAANKRNSEIELDINNIREKIQKSDLEYQFTLDTKATEINARIMELNKVLTRGKLEGQTDAEYETEKANARSSMETLRSSYTEEINRITLERDNTKKSYSEEIANLEKERVAAATMFDAEIAKVLTRGRIKAQTNDEFARELANATNAYNKGLKDLTDGFASMAKNHTGAEKEALSIQAEFDIINDKLKENSNSMVAKTLREGDKDHIVKPPADSEISSTNATDFMKQLKSASEVTNSEINRQYEKMQRRNSQNSDKK